MKYFTFAVLTALLPLSAQAQIQEDPDGVSCATPVANEDPCYAFKTFFRHKAKGDDWSKDVSGPLLFTREIGEFGWLRGVSHSYNVTGLDPAEWWPVSVVFESWPFCDGPSPEPAPDPSREFEADGVCHDMLVVMRHAEEPLKIVSLLYTGEAYSYQAYESIFEDIDDSGQYLFPKVFGVTLMRRSYEGDCPLWPELKVP